MNMGVNEEHVLDNLGRLGACSRPIIPTLYLEVEWKEEDI